MFLAYGVPNRCFVNHSYCHLRADLDYGDRPPALEARLRDAGLYVVVRPPTRPPVDACVASGWRNALGWQGRPRR